MLMILLHVLRNMNEIRQVYQRTQMQKIWYHMIDTITQ